MRRHDKNRKWVIDSAPGKGLIESLRTDGESSTLIRFFDIRVDWSGGYPLIHDRFVTYGAFDDLLAELDSDRKLALLPAALAIAESAPDRNGTKLSRFRTIGSTNSAARPNAKRP